MAQATVDTNTRRRDFLALTAAVATSVMAARPALASPPFYGAECPSYPACNGGCGLGCTKEIERVPDPILAAIEAHKAAAAETNVAQRRYSDFEDELHANRRLRKPDRLDDERRRGEEIEAALEEAHHAEQVAAYAILDVNPTTTAGVVALLIYATEYDDATHGMGWPEAIGCEGSLDTRTWQYFVLANLTEILPKLVPVSA